MLNDTVQNEGRAAYAAANPQPAVDEAAVVAVVPAAPAARSM